MHTALIENNEVEKANNPISELLVAGYMKLMDNDFFGLSGSTETVKEMFRQYGKTGLRMDGHSRGSMTVENALKSLMGEPDSAGLLGNTTINYFGPAANAKDSDKALAYLQGRENKVNPQEWELAYQSHASDPIGTLIGGNPATGGTFSLWEAVRAATGQKDTSHNCYGKSDSSDCGKYWGRDFPLSQPASFGGK